MAYVGAGQDDLADVRKVTAKFHNVAAAKGPATSSGT